MKKQSDKERADAAKKKVSNDEGQGQAGDFGSDGDMSTQTTKSPNRTSPSGSDYSDSDKPKKKIQR